MSDNGDVIHWRTVGAPDAWTIVVQEARGPVFVAHDTDLTGSLAACSTARIRCLAFPDACPPILDFEPACERGTDQAAWDQVRSREAAEALRRQGALEPAAVAAELGGETVAANVRPGTARRAARQGRGDGGAARRLPQRARRPALRHARL